MPKKPKSIPELFADRQATFDKNTQKILDSIAPALEAVHEFMDAETVEKAGGSLKWEDISLGDGDSEGPFLILIGVISFPPGTEMDTVNGGSVVVTEDTAPYFRRLVRAGIPVEITTKTKEEVVAYLKKVEEDELKQSEADFLEAATQQETDFDLSKLTEEQRKAYETTMLGPIGKA